MVLDVAEIGAMPAAKVLLVSPPCVGHSKFPVPALATAFRACELCSHVTGRTGGLLCDSPAARLSGGPEALDVARSAQGSCGPNARHLDMPAWR
ncbi:hypothetical protein [Variovorax sp. PAMC26660]|uniref:hypothetical protein n=1 Tax=Variovorax sp. PAMC26660 TaxID=2762322 RepID=UPI00164E9D60|nr:hypothetical protein [Variovorax sp. PAMC26660]QNK66826.1 hypothetical protein H7F35_27185 [Variovorax sp. PAMC26660]